MSRVIARVYGTEKSDGSMDELKVGGSLFYPGGERCTIASIREAEGLGGLAWFEAYDKHGEILGKLNARFVEDVRYSIGKGS